LFEALAADQFIPKTKELPLAAVVLIEETTGEATILAVKIEGAASCEWCPQIIAMYVPLVPIDLIVTKHSTLKGFAVAAPVGKVAAAVKIFVPLSFNQKFRVAAEALSEVPSAVMRQESPEKELPFV
jgi:hypothetical protein